MLSRPQRAPVELEKDWSKHRTEKRLDLYGRPPRYQNGATIISKSI
jgi:hypothetical protein